MTQGDIYCLIEASFDRQSLLKSAPGEKIYKGMINRASCVVILPMTISQKQSISLFAEMLLFT